LVPPKCWRRCTWLQGFTSQKTIILIVKVLDLKYSQLCLWSILSTGI
jgi:hypothetical protein